MIKFNELYVSADGKLHLEAQVKEDMYYDNVYIDRIIIDNQDTFVMSGPSNKPIYNKAFAEGTKVTSMQLDAGDLMLNTSDLYFVYIITSGTPSPDTPCGMDNSISMAIAYYDGTILNNYLNFIKEIVKNCEVPRGFTDYFFKVQAFKLAIETGNYTQAIRVWNTYFKGQSKVITSSGRCNCV